MTLRHLLLPVLILLPLGARADPAPANARTVIYLQPLGGELPAADVQYTVQALTAFYNLPVKVLPRVDLPRTAFYPPRRRYRADRLLPFLHARLPGDGVRIMGLTGVDISTSKGWHRDWGVLGLAALDGSACVISRFRCLKGARGPRQARTRLAKVAVHEVGHTLGLEHCPTRGCLMEDAGGKVATCDREHDLCPACRRKLAEAGRAIPAQPEIPWPRGGDGP